MSLRDYDRHDEILMNSEDEIGKYFSKVSFELSKEERDPRDNVTIISKRSLLPGRTRMKERRELELKTGRLALETELKLRKVKQEVLI